MREYRHGDGVKRLGDTVKKVVWITVLALMFLALVSFFVLKRPIDDVFGIGAGGVLGLFAFIDLKNALVRSSTMTPQKAKAYAAMRYALRFVIIGVVFALIIKSPSTSILGGVVGFVVIKIVVYATHLSGDSAYFGRIIGRK